MSKIKKKKENDTTTYNSLNKLKTTIYDNGGTINCK